MISTSHKTWQTSLLFLELLQIQNLKRKSGGHRILCPPHLKKFGVTSPVSPTKLRPCGRSQWALRPWSPYLIFILCRQPFFANLQKGQTAPMSEHGDVIIETQTVCLATYLSFWLLSEQCLATSV